jgi:formamidopyrimidine-DNA glycosylase
MPELPEVETIKEGLRELVVGSAIERAEVLDPTSSPAGLGAFG